MKFSKFAIILTILLRASVSSAGTFAELDETLNRAVTDAPKIAKMACTEHVLSHIRWNEWYYGYFPFRQKRKKYLGELYKLKIYDIDREESTMVRRVSDDGYTAAAFDQALIDSFSTIFSADFMQLLHFKSFYVNAIFHSEIFKETVNECVDFYGYEIPDMYEDILWHANLRNRGGFISTQILTTIVGVGAVAKVVMILPKAGKIAFVIGSAGASSYLAYTLIIPAIRQIKKIKEATENQSAVQVATFSDRTQWPAIYNRIIDLRDSAMLFNESKTELDAINNAAKFDVILKELTEKAAVLERIKRDYMEIESTSELSDSQKIDTQLLSFALMQIHIKLMEGNSND